MKKAMTSKRSEPKKLAFSPLSFSTTNQGAPNAPSATSLLASSLRRSLLTALPDFTIKSATSSGVKMDSRIAAKDSALAVFCASALGPQNAPCAQRQIESGEEGADKEKGRCGIKLVWSFRLDDAEEALDSDGVDGERGRELVRDASPARVQREVDLGHVGSLVGHGDGGLVAGACHDPAEEDGLEDHWIVRSFRVQVAVRSKFHSAV